MIVGRKRSVIKPLKLLLVVARHLVLFSTIGGWKFVRSGEYSLGEDSPVLAKRSAATFPAIRQAALSIP